MLGYRAGEFLKNQNNAGSVNFYNEEKIMYRRLSYKNVFPCNTKTILKL